MTWTTPTPANFALCQMSGHLPLTDDYGNDILNEWSPARGSIVKDRVTHQICQQLCVRCGLVYWSEAPL